MLTWDRFASNAILLPSLDMMSNLLESHAPALLSHVLAGRPMHSEMWAHWRGRYGLTEEQQADIWSQVDPEAKLGDRVAIESGTKETVQLRFQTFQGEIRDVEARMGDDLLRVGKANNLPSIEGVCGGNLGELGARLTRVQLISSTKNVRLVTSTCPPSQASRRSLSQRRKS